jgi:hypothetical protein
MTTITIDLPDTDSHLGVSLHTLETYAAERDVTLERIFNQSVARALGFEAPLDSWEQALQDKLAREGIEQKPMSLELIDQMRKGFKSQ